MMQINRFSFGKGFISLVIALSLTGCVDDKYDLKDIDTTSRVTVNNLTVPVNLESIKLDNVIDMDDNENIKTLTDANGNKYYALQEEEISTLLHSTSTQSVCQPCPLIRSNIMWVSI